MMEIKCSNCTSYDYCGHVADKTGDYSCFIANLSAQDIKDIQLRILNAFENKSK